MKLISSCMKDATAAKVAGYSGSIVGGAIFTVGAGLLFGVITAPFAAPLLIVGDVTGAMSSLVALGGTVGQMINKSVMSSAKKWMKENKTMCEDLMEKHDTLTTEHSHIIEVIPRFNVQLPQGITEISNIVSTWKEIIKSSATDATNLVAAAAAGSGLGVAQGVLETIDAGAEVSASAVKVAAKTAGSVAIGLSALVMVLDLGLLVKSGYDLNRLRKGYRSKAAKALINLAEAVRAENNLLREAHSQCTSGGNNSHASLVVCNQSLGNDERLQNGSLADLESHSNHPGEVLGTTSDYLALHSCENNES